MAESAGEEEFNFDDPPKVKREASEAVPERKTSTYPRVKTDPDGTFKFFLTFDGKRYEQGTFQTAEEANEAYQILRRKVIDLLRGASEGGEGSKASSNFRLSVLEKDLVRARCSEADARGRVSLLDARLHVTEEDRDTAQTALRATREDLAREQKRRRSCTCPFETIEVDE